MTAGGQFTDTQLAMTRYLRDPGTQPAPEGVEPRRLKIYRELIYNNIESFISGGFPVLRSLYNDADWQQLIEFFIARHACHTPYFLEISQEFLQFVMHDFAPRSCDPVFMAELAHYEWVELALDTSEEELPAVTWVEDVAAVSLELSPLAWLLSYHYPVHRIGPGYRPDVPGEPVYLLVYRDRDDAVQFMELNAASARMLELIRSSGDVPVAQLLAQLAAELGLEPQSVYAFGCDELSALLQRGALVTRNPPG